jgi:PAS domain S-box-containing protein
MSAIEDGSLTWKSQLRHNFNRLLEKRWTNVGLRAKMGLMVEIGLIALIAIFLFLGLSTARQTTQKILSERMMLARLSAAKIDSTLRQVQSIVEIINESSLTSSSNADVSTNQGLLETVYTHLSNASSGVLLFAPNGELLATAGEADRALDDSEIASVQGAVLKYDETNESQLITLPTSPLHTLILTRINLDEGYSEPGFMTVLLDLEGPDFTPLRASIDLGDTVKLDVVDAEGRVLISSHPESPSSPDSTERIWSRFFIAGKPDVETCLGCTESSTEEVIDEVVAFAPLSQAPWGVIVRQKASELMAPVNRLLVQTLLLGLATVIGALLLVWVTTNSVIWPVQMLKEATERIAQGDLDTPIKMPSPSWLYGRGARRDEIGDLAESFATMRRQLKRSMDEVIALNRELDARVQERAQAALDAQLEAQAARDDLRAIIDALNDELIVVNVDDRSIQLANRVVQSRNPIVEGLLGQTCSQVCDHSLNSLDADRECPVPLVVMSGNPVRVTHEVSSPGSDRKIYKEISASPMRDSNGRITRVVELTRDVTEKEELEESLIRRNQQLSILNAISITVNQSLNLEDILNRALEAVLKLTEIDVGAVFLQEDVQGSLKLMAYRGLSQEAAHFAAEVGMLDGSCGGVMDHGQIVIVADLSHYRSKRARMLQRENLNTLVHIPLIAKDCILGSMCVGTRLRRDFSGEEQELLSSIGRQIAIAIDNARLYAEVQAKERMRGDLLMKVIGAQEEERKRIARELHDETSQSLAALLFAFEEGLEIEEVDEFHDRLKKMHDLTQHTLDGVHKMIFDLRPSVLDHLGLVPAIRWFAETRLEPKGVRLSLEDFPTQLRLPPEVETTLFRVVQEAILNIARHAAARNVLIRFSTSGRDVWVEVEDDGVGFDPSLLTPDLDSMRGIGLLGMQERLEILGGDLEIHSAPGSGTRLLIHVPVEIVSLQLA